MSDPPVTNTRTGPPGDSSTTVAIILRSEEKANCMPGKRVTNKPISEGKAMLY